MDKTKEPTQEQLSTFVNHNIDRCQSSLVEFLLQNDLHAGVTHEDIVNFYEYKCSECGHGEADEDAFQNDKWVAGCAEDVKEYVCPYCKKEFDDEPEHEPQEIMEWWLCSDWLLNRLQERGEPVLRSDLGDWYGRTCSGQSMILDTVIQDIYKSLHNS